MTREEAIKTIQELMIACTPDSKYYKVGKMAISAMLENEELSKDLDEALKEIDEYEQGLEQEPCTDAVSRAKAIENVAQIAKTFAKSDKQKELCGRIIFMLDHMSGGAK